jgi:hypothetical protein
MTAYLYPTEDGWIPELLKDWKNSRQPKLAFPFYNFTVHTLPENPNTPFWMYLYHSKRRTEQLDLSGTVPYRVRVIHHEINAADSLSKLQNSGAHVRSNDLEDARTWFVCDVVEEILNADGSAMTFDDFDHAEGKGLGSSIISSVALVKRKASVLIHARHSLEVQD